ncbi:hypothetical protein K437DRAFT_224087 [Tilletiaria anomala UBC 951]|uniref:Phospholipid/glycerol acyltransferase domain-containing protein n=1 Tax=Tilletiaria anomala (strain ATCC 24038 / CBS 436.72 / UBC 951) TaxID=1037660 RepID=A0A066VZM6_TILAU|nr:uncharacterized protein K437DRAFT_224087 [Tilletiaria anomala UBC 951]KDN45743.1 hypothetical protein K437DRAFT_224087 [Tilletiaria anomala UBC 951]
MASNAVFDLALLFWRLIINIFFRSIQPRGSWRIPREGAGGPLIFVAAPHHNQFLDPLLLASEVRRASGRRVAFLTAEKSLKRPLIGAAARLMHSIPVARAADSAKPGAGTITLSPSDPLLVLGRNGTQFTTQLQVKGQLVLGKEYGSANAEVVEVLSDSQVRIKKEFKDAPGKKPVRDALAGDGSTYTVLPFVDQTQMYAKVYEKLAKGGSLGIFPEGGSHDRTDLLPLKAGVVIMALGAMAANPGLKVRIVPVGLSYFHPHRFRSRAVIEFGAPLDVPAEMVQLFDQGGDGKKKAVAQMMDIVFDGLKSVTVRAPDYETLMVIQAGRRLYTPPGHHASLGQVVELNRRFILGYLQFQHEPRVQKVKEDVMRYNAKLRYAGLRDHQVERATRAGWRSLGLLAYRIFLLGMWGGLALPGVVLNSPIFILAKSISVRKAKEALAASQVKLKGRDVLATWKVLVSLVVAPVLYTVYAGCATYLAHRYQLPWKQQMLMPLYVMAALPAIAYSTLKFGEVGIDIYKSLPPLFISLLPGNHKVIMELQQMRAHLSTEIHALIEEFAPQVWEDFESSRLLSAPSASAQPGVDKPSSATSSAPGVDSPLSHPLAWVDERLFGWGTKKQKRSRKSAASAAVAAAGDTAGATREIPSAEPRKSEKASISEEERKLREQFKAVLAPSDEDDAVTHSGFTTSAEASEFGDDNGDEEHDDGDYETVFRMLNPSTWMGGGHSASNASSRRSSRSRTRSRSGSGAGSFAEKRNRSDNNLRDLIMSPTEQRSNPLVAGGGSYTGRSSALQQQGQGAGVAAQRRARTHSLQEIISAEDLKNQGDASRQLNFSGASTVLETQAAGHAGLNGSGAKHDHNRRPPLADMQKASETPPGAASPRQQ